MEEENNKKEHPNSRTSLLKNCCYAAFYTLKGYFVKVKPALTIDKVVFSFVKKGTSGKGFDIYVDVDKFDLLCDSILSKELTKFLPGSSLEKPAWDYTTGDKGNKTLKIFQGNSGIIINGHISDTKQAGNVPVNYDDLRILAKWHRKISARYYDQLVETCINAMIDNAKFFENQDGEETQVAPDTNTSIVNAQQPKAGQGTKDAAGNKNKTNGKTGDEKSPKNPNEIFVMIRTTTNVMEYGKCGNYCFKGVNKKSKELVFIITPDSINAIGSNKWNVFYESTKKASGFYFNIGYVTCKDKLLVTSIESVAA